MADRELTGAANGGLSFAESGVDGYEGSIDPANIAAVTGMEGTDEVLISDSGTVKRIPVQQILDEDTEFYAGTPGNGNYFIFDSVDAEWKFYVGGAYVGGFKA